MRQTSARVHKRSNKTNQDGIRNLSREILWCFLKHTKPLSAIEITTTNINRLATAYGKVICNFYIFSNRSPPISLSRPCIYTFFMAILTFGPAVDKLATEPAKIYQYILSKLLSLKEVKKLLRNVFYFLFF